MSSADSTTGRTTTELQSPLFEGGRESESELQRGDFVPPERDASWGEAPPRSAWAGQTNVKDQETSVTGLDPRERNALILMWLSSIGAWLQIIFCTMCHVDPAIDVCPLYFSGWLWIIGLLATYVFYGYVCYAQNQCKIYLENQIIGKSLDDINDATRKAAPSLWWDIRCMAPHNATIVVHQARSYFFYDQWWDVTPQVLTTASEKPTRLRSSRKFTFADQETKISYDTQQETFMQINQRSPNVIFNCGIDVEGFPPDKCLVSVDKLGGFFSKNVMWLMHGLLLGVVYRHLFYHWTAATEMNNFKLLRKRYEAPPPRPVVLVQPQPQPVLLAAPQPILYQQPLRPQQPVMMAPHQQQPMMYAGGHQSVLQPMTATGPPPPLHSPRQPAGGYAAQQQQQYNVAGVPQARPGGTVGGGGNSGSPW